MVAGTVVLGRVTDLVVLPAFERGRGGRGGGGRGGRRDHRGRAPARGRGGRAPLVLGRTAARVQVSLRTRVGGRYWELPLTSHQAAPPDSCWPTPRLTWSGDRGPAPAPLLARGGAAAGGRRPGAPTSEAEHRSTTRRVASVAAWPGRTATGGDAGGARGEYTPRDTGAVRT